VPFGVPTTCRWFFACRNRARQNLAMLRVPFERTRRDLSNELSFARFEPIFEEIRASKGRSTRQGKRGRIQPRKTLGRARASRRLHGPNQVGVRRSKPLKTECYTTSIGRATSGKALRRLHGSHSDTPSLPMKKKWRWGAVLRVAHISRIGEGSNDTPRGVQGQDTQTTHQHPLAVFMHPAIT